MSSTFSKKVRFFLRSKKTARKAIFSGGALPRERGKSAGNAETLRCRDRTELFCACRDLFAFVLCRVIFASPARALPRLLSPAFFCGMTVSPPRDKIIVMYAASREQVFRPTGIASCSCFYFTVFCPFVPTLFAKRMGFLNIFFRRAEERRGKRIGNDKKAETAFRRSRQLVFLIIPQQHPRSRHGKRFLFPCRFPCAFRDQEGSRPCDTDCFERSIRAHFAPGENAFRFA